MNNYERGKKRMQEIYGDQVDAMLANLKSKSPEYEKLAMEVGYGEFFYRQGLSDKELELAVVATLIGQGNFGTALKAHLNCMLNVGWSEQQIEQIIIFLTAVIGFPSSLEVLSLFDTIKTENKKCDDKY